MCGGVARRAVDRGRRIGGRSESASAESVRESERHGTHDTAHTRGRGCEGARLTRLTIETRSHGGRCFLFV